MAAAFFHSKYRNYLFLVPLFVLAIAYQAAYTVTALYQNLDGAEQPQLPLLLNANGKLTVGANAARRAEIRNGDRLVSVNGVPANHVGAVAEAIRGKKPGDLLHVAVERNGTQAIRQYAFALEPAGPARLEWGDAVIPAFVLLIALGAIGLGVFVALRLPWDPSALSLFGVLIGLLQFVHVATLWQWPRWASMVAACYSILALSTWPVWMACFGIYFPERSRWDIKLPWLKWLLIVPLVAYGVVSAWAAALAHYSFAAARPWQNNLDPFGNIINAWGVAGILVFFVSLAVKIRFASPDARRRLRLLWAGAAVSLLPLFLLILWVMFFHHGDFYGISQVIEAPIVALLFLFPVTLAYVVLTERALDLRVVIRQGIRYAFAKTGLRVIVALLMVVFLWALATAVFTTKETSSLQIGFYVACVAGTVFLTRGIRAKTFALVDRRFFRDAYDAEMILTGLNEDIRTMIDERALLETVASRVSESLHVPCVAILLNQNGILQSTYALGCEAAKEVQLAESSTIVRQIGTGGEPAPIYLDAPTNWVFRVPARELNAVRQLNSQLILPIMMRERLLGLLSLGPKLSEEPYSKNDVQMLKSVVFQTGLALENSRLASTVATEMAEREKLNREIEIAREVQERLFPQDLPKLQGLDYDGACRPALGVGGDYYDFIPLADGNIGIAVGDVSGKGIAAALLMASLQASLRGQALQSNADLRKVMANVNRLVYNATPPNRYATFFYAEYRRDTRSLTYVNAGHNPPIVLRQVDGCTQVLRLETGGPVVGLFRDAPYQQGALTLQAGDVLIGFTDGISEAMNKEEEEWGEERLLPALEGCVHQSASAMIPTVMAEADRFVDGAPQHDDMTLIVMKLERAGNFESGVAISQ